MYNIIDSNNTPSLEAVQGFRQLNQKEVFSSNASSATRKAFNTLFKYEPIPLNETLLPNADVCFNERITNLARGILG